VGDHPRRAASTTTPHPDQGARDIGGVVGRRGRPRPTSSPQSPLRPRPQPEEASALSRGRERHRASGQPVPGTKPQSIESTSKEIVHPRRHPSKRARARSRRSSPAPSPRLSADGQDGWSGACGLPRPAGGAGQPASPADADPGEVGPAGTFGRFVAQYQGGGVHAARRESFSWMSMWRSKWMMADPLRRALGDARGTQGKPIRMIAAEHQRAARPRGEDVARNPHG